MEEDQNSTSAQSDQAGEIKTNTKKGSKKKAFLKIFILILIIALIAGGAWFLLSSPEQDGTSLVPGRGLSRPENETGETIPTPTATPTPVEINRSEIRIELLNGTGIAGEAGLVQSELEDLGYENIEVGNADDQDYEETLVTFSSELPQAFIEEFTETLEGIYTEVDSRTSTSLTDFDIRIIAGLRSSYTPAPTEEPEEEATPTPEDTETTPTLTVTPTPTP